MTRQRRLGGLFGAAAAVAAALIASRPDAVVPSVQDVSAPALPASAVPAPRRLRVEGRFFVTDGGTFRPVFASALSILAKPPAARAAVLDEAAALGFNGIRVFAGRLTWGSQTPEQARAVLPALLEEAAARGLYVYVVALTDTATGYDTDEHLRQVARIAAARDNALLEIANEIGHPTQAPRVNDPAALRELARRIVPPGVVWSLGAILGQDEPGDGRYPGDGGSFVTAHLARGGDRWTRVGRLRQIAALGEVTRKPALSGEPIGAAEAALPGRRESDPGFFFAMGALCRGFELGCVFHSEAGLRAERLGPAQRAAAEAFVAGWRALGTGRRLRPLGRAGSDPGGSSAAGAYPFAAGGEGFAVLLGSAGDSPRQWGGGWQDRGAIAGLAGAQVRRLGR